MTDRQLDELGTSLLALQKQVPRNIEIIKLGPEYFRKPITSVVSVDVFGRHLDVDVTSDGMVESVRDENGIADLSEIEDDELMRQVDLA